MRSSSSLTYIRSPEALQRGWVTSPAIGSCHLPSPLGNCDTKADIEPFSADA
jgi:hypothetical protein